MNRPEDPAQPEPDKTPSPDSRRSIPSEELLAGSPEVLIVHDGQTYRLRVTRSGKLILHK